MKRLAPAAPIVLTVLLVTGCSGGSSAEEGWTTPEVPAELSASQALGALPFDSFAMGNSEREQLQQGTAELLNRCLSDYNLSATFSGDYIQQVSEDPKDPFIYQWGGRLGTLPLDQAKEYGYAAPPGGDWSNGAGIYLASAENLNPVMPDDPTEAAQLSAAMYGPEQGMILGEGGADEALSEDLIPTDGSGNPPPEKGCYGAVEDQVGVSFVDLRDVTSDIYGLAFSHDAVKEKARTWSACMKDAGFDYARFEEAPTANAGAITADTIAAATADVECTNASRWTDTFYFVLGDYEQQAIDKQPEKFQSALDAERERLDAVNTLLGE
ncbi:hypothetical protein JOF42_000384 [Microbacterium phyllosphaerae]|uniref:Uncharacterized protein n=1 Tax=Microbacterium phyllosphaerae TaxID=124798 RepID=A0ABS4WL18_9MICO|nr:hypothetical protein [Microbacterium phyllosphaerae]MBP2376889.1 hypothetical protein [Microbacterium phyllosphaerae]